MANLISIPKYMPDPTTSEVVTGYQVQSSPSTTGLPLFNGTWTDIPGSPFTSNTNILDTTALATQSYQYRARPIRQVMQGGTPYVLDTPFSPPFTPNQPVYDAWFTRYLFPKLRFTYMNDAGQPQTNGTVLTENTGAGQGLWAPDGTMTRFPLQYVSDDDPVKVLNGQYQLIRKNAAGTAIQMLPDVDYHVEHKNGVVEFKTPPAVNDYLRFDFARADFINEDILAGVASAINTLSQFGINGYEVHTENNLQYLKTVIGVDLSEIVCKLAIWLMRQGATESALRSTTAWRDGGVSVDPYPSRALQFLVQDLQITEKSMQQRANAFIRSNTRPIYRGDFDMTFDMTTQTPVSGSLISNFGDTFSWGYQGSSLMGWWI